MKYQKKEVINLIIIGNTNNHDIANSLLKNKNINILAGVVDTFSKDIEIAQRKYLQENNIKEISFKEIRRYHPEICLMLTYNKIVPVKYFENTLLLNIHGGILPKWRGASTNAWAIINGENEVGYSLHEANHILDGGDIYYIYKSKIKPNEKYGEIIPKLRKGMIENLPNVLLKIKQKKLKPISQENASFLYTPRLRKEDGMINWNKKSSYIYNLFRVMGTPYGTGIYFIYRGKNYEITSMSLVNTCPNYIGIPGAIVLVEKDCMYVKTLDNIIKINGISCNEKNINIQEYFKSGIRL